MDRGKITKLIKSRAVHQIKSGTTHRFIDITIVAVGNRYFVRQYQFGSNSWRDAFLKNPFGEMKLKGNIVKIKGIIPSDLDRINKKINRAYHRRLPIIYFLMGLGYSKKKHEDSTIELVVDSQKN